MKTHTQKTLEEMKQKAKYDWVHMSHNVGFVKLENMHFYKELEAFLTLKLQEAEKIGMEKGIERLKGIMKDHYWDSLEKDRDIIIKHFDFILSELKAEEERDGKV